ncbi:hypothetical protein C6501_10435, partial [Candidatus Poribacteria bacterium]
MFSISLDSCEVKEIAEVAQNLVDEMNDLFGSLGSGSSVSLHEAEHQVVQGTQSLRHKLLEMFANQETSVPEPEPIVCPECDKPSVRQRPRERQWTTLCGVIRVKRWEYCCPEKHYHRPWDMRQKFRGKYTHRVAESMCRLSARLSFREASDELLRQ